MPTTGAMTDYCENEVLDHTLGTSAMSAPSAVYLALFPTDPGDDMTGSTELSAGGYSRQQVTFNAASNGAASNSADVTFGPATEDWGSIGGWALYDAATGGNALYHGAFETAKTVGVDDELVVKAGELQISLD